MHALIGEMRLIASEYIGQQNNVLISEMRLITRKYGVLHVGPCCPTSQRSAKYCGSLGNHSRRVKGSN